VLSGRLELSIAGGSLEDILGELQAQTEEAVAQGLADLLDVPQAWVEVALSVEGDAGADARRLQRSGEASAAVGATPRRLEEHLVVAVYKITLPVSEQSEDGAESISNIQDIFQASDTDALTGVLQSSFSDVLGDQFQILVQAFNMPSTSEDDALVPIGGTSTTAGRAVLSRAPPRAALTAAPAVTLVALMTTVLAW
jgi:hypothetical protein